MYVNNSVMLIPVGVKIVATNGVCSSAETAAASIIKITVSAPASAGSLTINNCYVKL